MNIRSFSDWSGMIPQKHNLKGNVKLITQVQSPIVNKKGDWLDGPSGQNYSEEYNKEGFLLKRISHDDFNKPTSADHYEYNSKGQISAFWSETLEVNPLWAVQEVALITSSIPKRMSI
ncbi:hypothetical protein GO730_07145 [Spirosoma sp. HMF3257]|uniref:Uncharacterized protein n=1 Tax=Spirosoma telluris TaxID=2183553 RepID=A0A327NNG0_9BACT|nr:hypothetical protein [Spirosoma telluris]RAI74158.1 hypothetical protein HMF3257_07075 [Spirosoma telluris]